MTIWPSTARDEERGRAIREVLRAGNCRQTGLAAARIRLVSAHAAAAALDGGTLRRAGLSDRLDRPLAATASTVLLTSDAGMLACPRATGNLRVQHAGH